MGHKATFYWECIKYAWHGSIDGANAAAPIPEAVVLYGVYFLWTGEKMTLPESALGGIELAAACLGAAWVMIFVIRICTAPAYLYSKQQQLIEDLAGRLEIIKNPAIDAETKRRLKLLGSLRILYVRQHANELALNHEWWVDGFENIPADWINEQLKKRGEQPWYQPNKKCQLNRSMQHTR
jgi:hypothetical protein